MICNKLCRNCKLVNYLKVYICLFKLLLFFQEGHNLSAISLHKNWLLRFPFRITLSIFLNKRYSPISQIKSLSNSLFVERSTLRGPKKSVYPLDMQVLRLLSCLYYSMLVMICQGFRIIILKCLILVWVDFSILLYLIL